jgi:aspartyl-tRNA(Asn)/glutamyl-tRNA(Gln) amidotransferase subunit A
VPLAWSLDHAGPMTRTVADAALLLEALAGPDRRDPRTRGLASSTRVTERGTTGLRVGVLRHDGSGDLPATDEVRAALRRGAEALGAAGASLDDIAIPEIGALRIASATILALEAAAYHAATLRSRGREIGPFMRQRLLGAYAQAPGAFVTAQTIRAELRRRVAAVFARIDLLVTPAQPASAPALGVPASTYYTLPANGLGLPAITVPVALGAERLPLAVQIIGRTADEGGVLAAAAAIERGVGRLGIPDAA